MGGLLRHSILLSQHKCVCLLTLLIPVECTFFWEAPNTWLDGFQSGICHEQVWPPADGQLLVWRHFGTLHFDWSGIVGCHSQTPHWSVRDIDEAQREGPASAFISSSDKSLWMVNKMFTLDLMDQANAVPRNFDLTIHTFSNKGCLQAAGRSRARRWCTSCTVGLGNVRPISTLKTYSPRQRRQLPK